MSACVCFIYRPIYTTALNKDESICTAMAYTVELAEIQVYVAVEIVFLFPAIMTIVTVFSQMDSLGLSLSWFRNLPMVEHCYLLHYITV